MKTYLKKKKKKQKHVYNMSIMWELVCAHILSNREMIMSENPNEKNWGGHVGNVSDFRWFGKELTHVWFCLLAHSNLFNIIY